MDKIKELVNEIDKNYSFSCLNNTLTERDFEVFAIFKETYEKNEDKRLTEKDVKIYFHEIEKNKSENTMEIQNIIIDYFSEYMKKNILFGEEEIIFMKLNDDIKIRIFEKLSETH
jgi:hypothetical protein